MIVHQSADGRVVLVAAYLAASSPTASLRPSKSTSSSAKGSQHPAPETTTASEEEDAMCLRSLPTLVLAGLATLAAGCAVEEPALERAGAVASESAPGPGAEQAEAETSEPETDPTLEEGETSEPEAEPALAEAEVEVAPSSTTSSPPEATTTTASALPADCDFSDHTADVLASVYQVVTVDGIGTAFYLGDGEWLTAAHVVGVHSRVALQNGLRDVSAAVRGIDYNADLALLEGAPREGQAVPALRVEEDEAPQPGDAAIVVGYPLYEEESASVSRGVVSRYEDDSLLGQLVVSDAAANPGNSGGPMLNECGNVIGVVVQKYVGLDVEGITYAVSTETITAQLPRLQRGFKGTPPTTEGAWDDPTLTSPADSHGWTITETEPDLLTGDVYPYMFVLASEVEREYDFYELPSLATNCWGEWSVWWGGDSFFTTNDEAEVVYRVGDSEALADIWLEDDELTWLSLSAIDALYAAGPDDELVVRAYDYDGDVFATAVFPLQGMSGAITELTALCGQSSWIPVSEDWGDAIWTSGFDGQLEGLRFQCPSERPTGLDAVLFPTEELQDEGRGFWMRYRFGNENAPHDPTAPSPLAGLDPSVSGDAFFVRAAWTINFQEALDADTTGLLYIDVVTDLGAAADPVASDTFNVSGWQEAKAELQATC